jgi:hypothetical protein
LAKRDDLNYPGAGLDNRLPSATAPLQLEVTQYGLKAYYRVFSWLIHAAERA